MLNRYWMQNTKRSLVIKNSVVFWGGESTPLGCPFRDRNPWQDQQVSLESVLCNQEMLQTAFFFSNLFIYFWLGWVLVSVRGLSPVAASGGHSSSRCVGLSLSRPLPLQSTGSRRAGSAVVAHGLSCSAACGIVPDQSSNPCPLDWQADSQPLRHQGSPNSFLKKLL